MSEKIKIINLKPGMENVNVEVRVLENLGVRTINTKAGVRTLGEYIVGDESGRVKLVLWGESSNAYFRRYCVYKECLGNVIQRRSTT